MSSWKQKLSSRKFWASLIGFVTAILVTFGATELTLERVAGLMTALGALVAYILAEAYVDGKNKPSEPGKDLAAEEEE